MINIVLQIRPVLGGAECAGMVALNHRNSHTIARTQKKRQRKKSETFFLPPFI